MSKIQNGTTETMNQVQTGTSLPKITAKQLTIDAMFVALTLVFTAFINIQLPSAMGGLIHLGNIPMFVAAMLFGKRSGAIAGGVGMAVFDLLSGWTLYAPCTFIVVGLMGYTTGAISNVKKLNRHAARILAMVIACVIKVAGYYVYEVFLYDSFYVPVASIPGNITQVFLAAIVVMIIIQPLSKLMKRA